MDKLLNTSKRFLEWAQSLPETVIPAGLESDMQEAIREAEAVDDDVCPECGHNSLVGGMCANAKCKKYVPLV